MPGKFRFGVQINGDVCTSLRLVCNWDFPIKLWNCGSKESAPKVHLKVGSIDWWLFVIFDLLIRIRCLGGGILGYASF